MCPPLHMPIVHGPVRSVKVMPSSSSKLASVAADKDGGDIEMGEQLFCNICFKVHNIFIVSIREWTMDCR